MCPPDLPRSRVEDLLFHYLEESESRPADEVLDELCRAEPAHAEALCTLIAELAETGLADQGETDVRIGKFRLIRRLGAGGMGVVHLAEELDLGRLVALKVVRPEQVFFESARLRFRREVESAARLSHPGIAAVYSVGEARGVPYFAQEYVPGAALDGALRALLDREPARLDAADLAEALRRAMPSQEQRPSDSAQFFSGSWQGAAARIALAAAEALEHAHERGVLHRDVKPSNLLLTPSGRVVLVDFGLATIADGARLTRTGSILGSLPYMAPEALDGGEATARSDVYSLGVTLYELATLSLPFVSNRAEELRRQIMDAKPLRPRQRNPELSRDLETIIGCAMERTPSRRYASAGAFAADLRAWLEQRPIAARPASALTKFARLVARRPAAVTAATTSALLVIGGPLVFAALQSRHLREVQDLNRDLGVALSGERASAESAEAHYQLAVQTIEHLLEQFSDRALVRYPVLAPLRLDAIERAIGTFEALLERRGDDARLIAQTAQAYRARGDVLYDLRRMEDSLAAQRHQNELLRALTSGAVYTADAWHELGVGLSRATRALSQLRRHAEAIATMEEALAAARRAIELAPESFEYQLALASHLNNYGMNLGECERFDEARDAFDACIEEADRLARARPDDARPHEVLGRALRHRYSRLMAPLGTPERLPTLRRARAAYEAALALEPGDRGLREDLADLDLDLAAALLDNADVAGARAALEVSAAASAELVAQFPDIPDYEVLRFRARGLLAHTAQLQGAWPEAREAMRLVAESAERILVAHPGDAASLMDALMAWINFANVQINAPDVGPERFSGGAASLARAADLLAALDAGTRGGVDGRAAAFQIGYNQVVAFANLGRLTDAERVASALQPVNAGHPWELRLVADAWCEVRNARAREAEEHLLPHGVDCEHAADEALRWLAAAVEHGYDDRAELESTPALEALRGDPRFDALLARLPR
ncbi:MAG: serine/threonine-protein kinase [Planctomycetota bacterium]